MNTMEFSAPNKEYLFAQILNRLSEGIITIDNELHVTYANPSAITMAGMTESAVLGKPAQSVFQLINSQSLGQIIPGALPNGEDWVCFGDVVLRNVQHGQVIVDCFVRRITGADNAPLGYLLLLRDVSESKKLSAMINFRDNYDSFTGLYNAAVFMEKLQESLDAAKAGNTSQALLYIDLDFFQGIKNTGGVETGGALLQEAAGLIRKNTGCGNISAHLKKDDFALLLLDCSQENVNTAAKRLLEAFRRYKFMYAGKPWAITISVGAYTLTGKDSLAETALHLAFSACREAYKKGGNRAAYVSASAPYESQSEREAALPAKSGKPAAKGGTPARKKTK
ncbi:MAG: diguanylate cyclase [Spirochaetaceae bacterium]|nr:diguanylate cyclase [Spirochaetaceae bacterium]